MLDDMNMTQKVNSQGIMGLDFIMIGKSFEFQKSLGSLEKIAQSSANVLIQGETGTGKELVARAIHYLSPHAGKPWLAINCAALQDSLMESEFFGHIAGAFTNAVKNRQGFFSLADDGTLFLDELDSLSPKGQQILLRVLQEKRFRPIGSERELSCRARILAATNQNLSKAVAIGKFRKDLFYRLNIFQIQLPKLRNRKVDIPELARHFILKHTPDVNNPPDFSEEANNTLINYSWPGNVRELENAVIRAVHLNDKGVIKPEHLGIEANKEEVNSSPLEVVSNKIIPMKEEKLKIIANFERKYLTRLMQVTNGNVSLAARMAMKERRELGKMLKKYAICPRKFHEVFT